MKPRDGIRAAYLGALLLAGLAGPATAGTISAYDSLGRLSTVKYPSAAVFKI
jgi:hypothetical protein